MANQIKSSYGASTALTITLASLANNSAQQAAQVAPGLTAPPRVMVHYKIRTGTSPTDNAPIEFYVSRADDDATTEHADGGTGTADAAFSGNTDTLQLVHSQPVKNTSDTDYKGSFIIDEPGPDWRLVVLNKTGAALNATGSNHYIRYQSVTPEVQ